MIERNYKKGVGYKAGLDSNRIVSIDLVIVICIPTGAANFNLRK